MTSVTTDRRLGLTGSAAIKVPCKAATTSNITLSGAQTIDGVSCTTGDRVLVRSQTSSVDNGVYVVDTGTWTRDLDFDGQNDVTTGTIVMVLNGSTNANTYWRVTTASPITFGSSAITFDAALAGDSASVAFSTTGGTSRTVQQKLRDDPIDLADYLPSGYVTDGSVDYATQIALAMSAAAGKGLRFPSGGGTYQSSTAQTLQASTWLYLRGSTLKFTASGATECLQLRSGTRVSNGTVQNAGSAPTGGGNYQCPIVIGNIGSGTGYTDITVEDVALVNNRADGLGLLVTGSSSNITLRNITGAGDSTTGALIAVEWGGQTSPTAGTYHPYNITIDGVDAGTYSRAASSAIYLSGVLSAKVSNVHSTACITGVTVYCGDYGIYYASANIKAAGFGAIKVENVRSEAATTQLVKVDMQAPSAPGTPIYATDGLVIEDCVSYGVALAGAGYTIANCYGATIRNCKATNSDVGVSTGTNVERLHVLGGIYWANNEHGVSIANGSVAPNYCVVDGVYAYGNGVGGGNKAGVYVQNGESNEVKNCTLGVSGESTQVFGVRIDTTATNAVVVDNHNIDCKDAGVAFSVGSSTTWVTKRFKGNTSGAIGGGGQIFDGPNPVIVDTEGRGNTNPNNLSRVLFGTGAPSNGTWAIGDRWIQSTPVAGQPTGGMCTVAGTPGTWVNQANL